MTIGGKMAGRPTSAGQDYYSQRLNSSLAVYNAELVPPATHYATVRSALRSNGYRPPAIGPKVRAAYVWRGLQRTGNIFAWAWGAVDMFRQTASLPFGGGMDGTVRRTAFQPALVQLHDWQLYPGIRMAGWNATGGGMFSGSKPVRYDYWSFRSIQPTVPTSGGPGPVGVRMQPRNRYTAVQQVSKATARQRYYNTRSATPPVRRMGGGASNAYTTSRTTR